MQKSEKRPFLTERERLDEEKNVAYKKRIGLAKGGKKPANRGKGTGKQGERCVLARCGRPPSSIRAGALIREGGRPYMLERTAGSDFYSLELFFFGKNSYTNFFQMMTEEIEKQIRLATTPTPVTTFIIPLCLLSMSFFR